MLTLPNCRQAIGLLIELGDPAGRAAGPDIWEIARAFRDAEGDFDGRLEYVAETMALAPAQIRAAIRYYATFRDEIDTILPHLSAIRR